MAAGDILYVVGSLEPNRPAFKFIATADEAILVDAWAVAREAAADTTGTMTAWVNIPDITGDYAILSAGDTAAIEFITLRVTAGKVVGECNAATVDQWEHTSTDVVITPHKWHHIALTQDASLQAPKIYVDGVRVAQTVTLATDNAAWFGQCGLIDDGSIGAGEEAGAAAQIRECKGGISDVKYWPSELTAEQVMKDYKGYPPASIKSDLTDWWPMTENANNSVTAANNGTAGASILNISAYSEFTSRVAFLGQIVADVGTTLAMNEKQGIYVVVKAA